MNRNLALLLAGYQSVPEFVGVDLNNLATKSSLGNYPMHIAAATGHPEDIKLLHDHGADPNASGDLGYTPLHDAVEQGNKPNVIMLLGIGADPKLRNFDGVTPTELAELLGYADLHEHLIGG